MTVNDTEEQVRIDSKARRVKGIGAGNTLINLGLASTATGSATLDANGGANDQAVFTVTLSHAFDQRIFATPHWTVYEGSVADNNAIRDGSNVDRDHYDIDWRIDWGETDNSNVVLKVYVINLEGAQNTVLIRVNWRFIVETPS